MSQYVTECYKVSHFVTKCHNVRKKLITAHFGSGGANYTAILSNPCSHIYRSSARRGTAGQSCSLLGNLQSGPTLKPHSLRPQDIPMRSTLLTRACKGWTRSLSRILRPGFLQLGNPQIASCGRTTSRRRRRRHSPSRSSSPQPLLLRGRGRMLLTPQQLP